MLTLTKSEIKKVERAAEKATGKKGILFETYMNDCISDEFAQTVDCRVFDEEYEELIADVTILVWKKDRRMSKVTWVA